MARKVLISFLGTGNYHPVFYSWNNKKTTAKPTKFIQEAIASKICKSWGKDDCIMVFRTTQSNQNNWIDSTANEGAESKGLEATLKSLPGLICRINPEEDPTTDSYLIPAGFSEQETEEIFKCVFDKLKEGDEIYFDMTHAFRSIPIFANTLFNYARFLKKTKVKGVYYGAFEALGHEVRQWTPEQIAENPAPIVDMTSMVLLQDLATSAASFRNFGNLRAFSDLLANNVKENLDTSVDDMIEALGDLDLYIQTSCIDDIKKGECIKTICVCFEDFCKSPHTSDAQRKLIREIQTSLSDCGFKPKSGNFNVEAAIKWAIDHKMIQQAYTMAKEYVISRLYEIAERDNLIDSLFNEIKHTKKVNEDNKVYETRTALSQILTSAYYNGRYYVVDYKNPWNKSPIAKKLFKNHQNIGKLKDPYESIKNSRNLLAHAVTTDDGKDYQDYIKEFYTQWKKCLDALFYLD